MQCSKIKKNVRIGYLEDGVGLAISHYDSAILNMLGASGGYWDSGVAKDTLTVNMTAKVWQWPKKPRQAWLRKYLPVMLRRYEWERNVHAPRWLIVISWNLACPIIIWRAKVELTEGVENGE